jgi:farnesyl diphosphate synthase
MNALTENDFEAVLALRARQVEKALDTILDQRPRDGEIARPERLLAAMRHGVLNGGKRLRPFLVMESAALFDADPAAATQVAAAVECVHCYSLIHDDLPAMDDDDLRRGKPTVHRAFDEATAILAGDSLLTLAFDILAGGEDGLPPAIRSDLVLALARAAGAGGMAGGQALDLQAETTQPDEAGIIMLQAMKTGALIRFSCEAGAIVGRAAPDRRAALREYGNAIGLAFQLADDLLDLAGDSAALGKATGKDAAAGKATLAALHGEDWARRQLGGLVDQAEASLAVFGSRAATLRAAARFVAERRR